MNNRRTVLITGASTGIGASCATELAKRGWRVFAGVRSMENLPVYIGESPEIEPVLLDVTKPDQIAAAAEEINETCGDKGLDALVNNAGVAIGGPIELIPKDKLQQLFDVNVLGLVQVTQAMLPMLRKAKGRLVLMSSNSGRVAHPFLGVYAATKFAVEALGDSLRGELHESGVQVSLIEPGVIETPIWKKSLEITDDTFATTSKKVDGIYDRAFGAVRKMCDQNIANAAPAEWVAEAVIHALESRKPRTRYQVGRENKLVLSIVRLLPDRLRDKLIRRSIGLD